MRKLGIVTATALAALMLFASAPVSAGNPKGICQAGGVNRTLLAPAMEKYWRWYYGGVGTQTIGRFFLVPLPNGDVISEDPLIFQGSTSFTVRTGKTLVLPLAFFLGESYVEGPPDDPANYPMDYRDSTLLLTVDGRVVADSSRTKLDCLYVPVTYLDDPIVYPEPSSYGSTAAIWMTGIGILLPPMSPGDHVIELQVIAPLAAVYGFDLGYYNTWYVHVAKK